MSKTTGGLVPPRGTLQVTMLCTYNPYNGVIHFSWANCSPACAKKLRVEMPLDTDPERGRCGDAYSGSEVE